MADLKASMLDEPGVARTLKDMGDGTYAEVIVAAGDGVVASASFTPAAAAYGIGTLMDAVKEMAFIDRNGIAVPAGSLIRILSTVIKIDVNAVPSGQTSYTGRLYSAAPSVVQADQAAWFLKSADLGIYRGPIGLGTPVDEGDSLYVKSQYVDTDIKLVSSSLFMHLATDGAHTAAAVARQVLLYGVLL